MNLLSLITSQKMMAGLIQMKLSQLIPWFWPYLRKDLSYYSLEVYTHDIEVLKNQIKFAHNMLAA